MPTCTCPNESYVQSTVEGVVICTKITTIPDIACPEGYTTIIRPDGTAYCSYYDSVAPTITPVKEPKDFDNEQYFEDVSWTIAFKAGEGWNSYFTFYPDYTISKTDLFETGYNWGQDAETLWQHPMNNNSFQVFQGRLHPFLVEYPITNENTNKLLNSISLNVESKRWQNAWDYAQHPEIGFNKAYIWNNTNNSGLLELNEQKTLSQVKDYPKTKNGSQEILFTALEGKHTFNYFYNRIINERNNVPMFTNDKNRIFKEINSEAVSFKGKPVLEKLKGEVFNVTLINDKESRFNILLKNSVNDSTVYE
jgi:hypothetical protein